VILQLLLIDFLGSLNDGVIDVIGNQGLMQGECKGLCKAGCGYFYSVYGQFQLCKVIVLRVLWRGSK
jgi:hypothetical protein